MKRIIYLLTLMLMGVAILAPGLAQSQSSTSSTPIQTVEKAPTGGCPLTKNHTMKTNGEHKIYKHHVKWHMKKSSCPNKDCMNKEAPKKPCPVQ